MPGNNVPRQRRGAPPGDQRRAGILLVQELSQDAQGDHAQEPLLPVHHREVLPVAPGEAAVSVGAVRYLDTGGAPVMVDDSEGLTIIWLMESGGDAV